jgi:hypothetical protein
MKRPAPTHANELRIPPQVSFLLELEPSAVASGHVDEIEWQLPAQLIGFI